MERSSDPTIQQWQSMPQPTKEFQQHKKRAGPQNEYLNRWNESFSGRTGESSHGSIAKVMEELTSCRRLAKATAFIPAVSSPAATTNTRMTAPWRNKVDEQTGWLLETVLMDEAWTLGRWKNEEWKRRIDSVTRPYSLDDR